MVLYHSSPSLDITPGTPFLGCNREKLSEFLGGPVGFACVKPAQAKAWGWLRGEPHRVYELILPDSTPLIASLNGEDIPQRDYDGGWDFLRFLAEGGPCKGEYWYGTARELQELISRGIVPRGEIAFLAAGVIFGSQVEEGEK